MTEADWKARAVALAHADMLRIAAAAAVGSARSARARRGWSTRRVRQLVHVKQALQLINDMSFLDLRGRRMCELDERGRLVDRRRGGLVDMRRDASGSFLPAKGDDQTGG